MTKSRIKDQFLVRSFREDDFEAVAALWKQTEMDNPERGDDSETILNTIRLGGKLFILENKSSGLIAGTSWLTFDGRRIFLHHFGILPEFQGKGLSKLLLGESLRFVKASGYQVKLEVHAANHIAIKLYESFGFRHLGDYMVYIIRDVPNMEI
ncbi:MAG: GNAT family N-acetyltransferase [Bacteroidales bacterium]|nr:GNAT family N-acetyltransferase [Bacteroidales bacterium]